MMMIIAATNQPNNRLSPAIVEKETECNLCMIGYHTHTHTTQQTHQFSVKTTIAWLYLDAGLLPNTSSCFLNAQQTQATHIYAHNYTHTHSQFFKSICYFSKAVIIINYIRSYSKSTKNPLSKIPQTHPHNDTRRYPILRKQTEK